MGLTLEILKMMADPQAIIAGIGVGILLLTQPMRLSMAVFVIFIAWAWIVGTSDLQIDALSGVYSYPAQHFETGGHFTYVNDKPAKFHLEGVRMAAAIIWLVIVRFGVGHFVRRSKAV